MENTVLSDLYIEMQNEMIQTLKTAAPFVGHSGTKGSITEQNWIEWFRAHLPQRYKVDQATIIDSKGNRSQQIDMVIYDAQYSYSICKRGGGKFIPAESVYAVFEIKQIVNRANIKYAGEKAKSVRKLDRTSVDIPHAGGTYSKKDRNAMHEIVAGLLTTGTAWKGSTEKNVIDCIKEIKSRDERLDFICAISQNTFVIENNCLIGERVEDFPEIKVCGKEKSLVYLLLMLLKRLQYIGTVPAISFDAYAAAIEETEYKETEYKEKSED